jgi:hypothetical protein
MLGGVFLILTCAGLIPTALFYAKNLAKDIYVPEIRVYEEFKDFKK